MLFIAVPENTVGAQQWSVETWAHNSGLYKRVCAVPFLAALENTRWEHTSGVYWNGKQSLTWTS